MKGAEIMRYVVEEKGAFQVLGISMEEVPGQWSRVTEPMRK